MSNQQENQFFQDRREYTAIRQENQHTPENDRVQHKCLNCGWGVSATADICENCGEWLLKGKCNFCYTEVEEGQKFCSECGNPPEGIHCTSCGTLSHFDFCPQCNIALTEQAGETIELIRNSVEFQNLLNISNNEDFNAHEKIEQSDIELEKLKKYLAKFADSKPKKKNLFEIKDGSNGRIEENLKAIEQSKQRIQHETQKQLLQQQKEIQAKKLMEDIRNQTFPTNQEARKFFGALKILIPGIVEVRTKKKIKSGKLGGWRCNFADVIHTDGPQGCGDPSLGGEWISDTETETEIEIIEKRQGFIEKEI